MPKSPKMNGVRKVLKYLKMESFFVDPTVNGYRVKLITELDPFSNLKGKKLDTARNRKIKRIEKKLKAGGFNDVWVGLRGYPSWISLIVPYSKDTEIKD